LKRGDNSVDKRSKCLFYSVIDRISDAKSL